MNLYVRVLIDAIKKVSSMSAGYQNWIMGASALTTVTVVAVKTIPHEEKAVTKTTIEKSSRSETHPEHRGGISNPKSFSATAPTPASISPPTSSSSPYEEHVEYHYSSDPQLEETTPSFTRASAPSFLNRGLSSRIMQNFRNPASTLPASNIGFTSPGGAVPTSTATGSTSPGGENTWTGSNGFIANTAAQVSAVIASATGSANTPTPAAPATGNSSIVNPSGGGATSPSLTWSPLTKNFGNIAVHASTATQIFTFANTGTGAATGCSAPTISNITDFTIQTDNCGTSDVPATSGTCTLVVHGNPTSAGTKTATLSRNCSDGGTITTTANQITVTGTQATLAWSPLIKSFGNVVVGAQSSVQIFTLSNSGTANATGCSSPTISNTTDFTISTNGCGTANVNSGGDSCTIDIQATPASTGLKTATISRTCTLGGTVTTTTNQITVTGTTPALAWDIQGYDFGAIDMTTATSAKSFTLKNTGTANASGCSAPTLSNSNDFTISHDGCGTANLNATNGSCTVEIKATPKNHGPLSTTLSRICTIGGSVSTNSEEIKVTSLWPKLYWDLDGFDFGQINVGDHSPTQKFIFINDGDTDAKQCTPPVLGDDKNFSIVLDTCDKKDTEGKGGTCAVEIQANPTEAGKLATTLERYCEIGGNITTEKNEIKADGASVVLAFDPLEHDFGDIAVGAKQSVWIKLFNLASRDADAPCSAPDLTNSGEIFITDDQCKGIFLKAGEACNIELTAQPTKSVEFLTTLKIECGKDEAQTREDRIRVQGK